MLLRSPDPPPGHLRPWLQFISLPVILPVQLNTTVSLKSRHLNHTLNLVITTADYTICPVINLGVLSHFLIIFILLPLTLYLSSEPFTNTLPTFVWALIKHVQTLQYQKCYLLAVVALPHLIVWQLILLLINLHYNTIQYYTNKNLYGAAFNTNWPAAPYKRTWF